MIAHERVAEVIDITLRELRKLKTDTVSQVELDSAKEQLKGNILLSLESSDNRMSKLAKNEIFFGCYQPLQEIMDGFDRVTAKSLQLLCERLFDDRYLTLVLLGREGRVAFPAAHLTL